MRIALHQPDIAGNVGTLLRLGACLDVGIDVIEPCGFPFGDRAMRRAGMDYAAQAALRRHVDFTTFRGCAVGRLVLLTTRGGVRLPDFAFLPEDTLLLGSEGAGVPESVHAAADAAVRVPMRDGCRSLNVAVAAGMALAEALRQTGGYPA